MKDCSFGLMIFLDTAIRFTALQKMFVMTSQFFHRRLAKMQ